MALLAMFLAPSLPRGGACVVGATFLPTKCGGNRCSMLRAFRHPLDGMLAEMRAIRSVLLCVIQPVVLAVRRAECHVLWAIVSLVLVQMVDSVPRWDRAVNGFPYHAVLQFPSFTPMLPALSSYFDQNVAVIGQPSRADRLRVPRRDAVFAHTVMLPELR